MGKPFSFFSGFVPANVTGGPLPITLVSFYGYLAENTALFYCKSDNDAQLSACEIQRSYNGDDFKKLAQASIKTRIKIRVLINHSTILNGMKRP